MNHMAQPQVKQPEIVVPDDMRDLVEEYSIRANSFQVATRDYQVAIGKLLQALLVKVTAQGKEIVDLKKQIPVAPEQSKATLP